MLFLAIRKRLDQDDRGFTLIELLIVVIIIGILAAIAIPTFLQQRQRGWEAAAQSELRNAAVAQQSHFTEANAYTDVVAELEAQGWPNDGNVTETITADAASYCMTAVHDSGGDTFALDSDTGEIARGGAC